jgi:Big-like domain-containing protein/Ig-like domain-containing protein/beta-propeller repeat-containing protein
MRARNSASYHPRRTHKPGEFMRLVFWSGAYFTAVLSTTEGATVVDQQYVPSQMSVVQARSDDYNGQSFMVGQWGILKRIEIWVAKDFGVTNDMAWTLFRFNGDIVQNPFLAEVTVPSSAIPTTFDPSNPNMIPIDLSALSIVVNPGDYLGMVVHSQIPASSQSGINWYGGTGTSDGYPRGVRLQSIGIGGFGVSSNDDRAFRTLVELAEPPIILNQPPSQTTGAGSNVMFSVLASGTPSPRYRWRFNGTDIFGATNTTLVITNVQLTNIGNYTVEITNLFGSVTSSPATLAFGEPPGPAAFQWVKQGGGPAGASNYSQGQAIAVDPDGNCYVTGQFSGAATFGGTNLMSIGQYDVYVAKYSKVGVLQWVRQAGSTNSTGDGGIGIAVDGIGNCFVTGNFFATANFGSTNLTSVGARDIFIAKYDREGVLQWARGTGGTDYDGGQGIALDSAGNIYVTGGIRGSASFGGTNIISNDDSAFLAKYDSSGTVLWVRTAVGGQTFSVAIDGSGNSFISGFFWSGVDFGSTNIVTASAFGDAFLAKYDSSGVLEWVRQARSIDSASGYAVALDGTGKCYWAGGFGRDPGGNITLGNTTLYSSGGGDIFIAKYDSSGICEWARQAGGNSNDSGYGITVDASGNCYVTGLFMNSATFGSVTLSGPSAEIFVAKYDSAGILQWAQRAGGSKFDIGQGIGLDSAGNCYVTGSFQTNAAFGDTTLTATNLADLFLAKLAASSNTSPMARGDSFGTTINTPVEVLLFKLLANDSDIDGDALAITGLSAATAQGGTVSMNGDFVAYTPTKNFVGTDTFTYTVSDGRDGTAVGTVNVTVTDASVQSKNIVSITPNPLNSRPTIQFAGIPRRVYTIQTSPNVNGPWSNIGTVSAGTNGLGTFEDPIDPPPAQRFYRTLAQ